MSTHPGYWGGSSVTTGRVRKLPVATFKQLVEQVINIPVQFPLTKNEFWNLTDKERDTRKDGAFVTACAFSGETETRRCEENVTHSVAVILDLDEGDFLVELDAHPETIADSLYPYNFVVWRTAKSRPESPRLKIMVDVEPCPPSQHKRILSHIAYRLGLPNNFKGVKESSVVSQAQYRPIHFRGSEFTSVIASNVAGIPLHISDLPELEPDEEELINGRTYACDMADADDEFFGLAFLPVANLELEDVIEALDAIDPDCERPTWVSVAAALRHQFTEESQAQASYEAFLSWSARGKKYAGRKDVWSTWRSLKAYARGRAPRTIRTLFKFAMDAGWENKKVADKLAKTTEEWLDNCTDKGELMQEGARRIVSMPFRNDVVESSLINAWQRRIKAVCGETIEKTVLKKEINKVRKEDKKAKQEVHTDNTPAWLRPIVYCGTTDTFLNLGNGVALKPGAFDRFYAKELMFSEEIPANGLPIMQPGAFALNIQKILRVEDTIYDPTHPESEKIFPCPDTGKLFLNTYVHSSVPVADPEFKDKAEKLFRQLLKPLIKEPWLVELVISYCALQCQYPGRKIPWSFLIQSGPGAGKGTFGEIMEAVLGPINVKIVSPQMMNAPFNDWARNCVLGVFNEVHIPGDRRDAVMNSIKPLISDPTIAVSIKHQDAQCRVKNTINWFAFSNFKDAAYLASEDRRWCIIFSPTQTHAQALKLQASGHFEEVRWLTTPEGASALRYFLLKRVISDTFPLTGHAPTTTYREEVVNQSKNPLQITIEDLISDQEDPLITPEVIHDGKLKERLCRSSRDANLMSRYLSLIGYERYDSKRLMIDGCQRGYIWVHTERWQGSDPVEFLKARVKSMPGLEDNEIGFS